MFVWNGKEYTDILAVVGSTSFTDPEWEPIARGKIMEVLAIRWPDAVVSGGADGVDRLAEEIAQDSKIPRLIFPAVRSHWSGPGGFKERNILVAGVCSRLLRIYCDHTAACTHRRTYGSGWTAEQVVARLGPRAVRQCPIPPPGVPS